MSKKHSRFYYDGQIALPYVLAISAIIVEIAITGTVIAILLSTNTAGRSHSIKSLSVANSSFQDLIKRLSENKEFGTKNYCFYLGNDGAQVNVFKNDSSSVSAYIYEIDILAKSGNKFYQAHSDVTVDKETGEIHLNRLNQEEISMTYTCS